MRDLKIDINKDFEEAFPNEFYSGFTLWQCAAALAGLALSGGTGFLLWKYLGLPVVECSYLTIPLMIPVCALGFFRYQNKSLAALVREMAWHKKTGLLLFAAGEFPREGRRVFRTGREPEKRKRKQRIKKRKGVRPDGSH